MTESSDKVQGRMPGAESFSHVGDSSIGILVSHGFTGMPGGVLPLAKALAAAGYQVECPCLRGHGTQWQDIVGVTMEDWLEDLEQAVRRLRERCQIVFVMGLSMGGTLALRLAQRDPSIAGVVVINHALVFGDPRVRFAGLMKGILKSTPGIASDIKDPRMVEPAYDRTPTAGVAQLWRLAKLVRADLPGLRQPLLVLKSREDHVLPVANAELTMREAGSEDKRLIWLDNSYHVATLDYDKDLIAEECLAFVRRLAKENA